MNFRTILESKKGTVKYDGNHKMDVKYELRGKKYFLDFVNKEGKRITDVVTKAEYRGTPIKPEVAIDAYFKSIDY